MSYDFRKWVDNDLAAGRYPWLRWACLVPFVALPASFVMEVTGIAGSGTGGIVSALLTLVGLAAGLAACFSPYARQVWGSSWNASARSLDERQRLVVLLAHAKAYAVLTGAFLAAFYYAGQAADNGWWLPRDRAGVSALFRTLFVPLIILPIALAEWSVPPPDDLDD